MPGADFVPFPARALKRRHPWLPAALAERYAHAYGTRAELVLADAKRLEDLGTDLGEGLYEAELNYLTFYEWALTATDILWRRSKLGLHASPAMVDSVDGVAGRRTASRPVSKRNGNALDPAKREQGRARARRTCTASISTSPPARSTCCSARRRPARPRCCG